MEQTKRNNYAISKIKTEVSTVSLNQEGVRDTIVTMAKSLAGFDQKQAFEKVDVKFGRHGGAIVTFTNPKIMGVAEEKIPR